MVKEDEERCVTHGFELPGDPFHPRRAELTVMLAVACKRIEIQNSSARNLLGVLNKAVIAIDLREERQQRIAVVMVSRKQPVGQTQGLDFAAQHFICSRVVQLDQVTGDDDTIRVGVQRLDFFQAGSKVRQRIDASRPVLLRIDEVEIGEPYELRHTRVPSFCGAMAIAERSVAAWRGGIPASLRSE